MPPKKGFDTVSVLIEGLCSIAPPLTLLPRANLQPSFGLLFRPKVGLSGPTLPLARCPRQAALDSLAPRFPLPLFLLSPSSGLDHLLIRHPLQTTMSTNEGAGDVPVAVPAGDEASNGANNNTTQSSTNTSIPPLGQTRCYWTVMDCKMNFKYLDPVLQEHMGEVGGSPPSAFHHLRCFYLLHRVMHSVPSLAPPSTIQSMRSDQRVVGDPPLREAAGALGNREAVNVHVPWLLQVA